MCGFVFMGSFLRPTASSLSQRRGCSVFFFAHEPPHGHPPPTKGGLSIFHKKTIKIFDTEYLTITGVAQTLGLSERKAHAVIHDKSDPIPNSRLGRKLVRVRRADLHSWMERRRADVSRVDRIVEEVLG